ncbi:MAG: TIGR00730 family Rossman fold protein, partial [Desulfovibrio sp.]|nr:TIGR00730 family Rossman fold protein [Desulfovibrio sp.]
MSEIRHNIIDDLSSLTTESWRTFRIMAEMVEGFDTLNKLAVSCISVFGSARAAPDSQVYGDAEKMAAALVRAGFGIITGGGPGVMEAANKGAHEAGGVSVGLHIHLPHEQ